MKVIRKLLHCDQEPVAPVEHFPPSEAELDHDREYFVKGLRDIRQLLQRAGTALGAAATAVLVGLGYAQLHDVFPLPSGNRWLPWLALFFAVAAVVGSIVLAASFFSAQRRIIISPKTLYTEIEGRDFSKDELCHIEQVYEQYVARYAPTREKRKRADLQLVQQLADDLRDEGQDDLAQRMAKVVKVAQLDAVTSVLEHRSSKAFRGLRTAIAIFLASVGIVGLFAVADYSESKRQPDPAGAKTRAETAKIKADTALVCDELREAGAQVPRDVCPP